MIKEYYVFIKNYLKVAELHRKYLLINIITSFLYKGLAILLPFVGSFMVKYLMIRDARMVYFCLFFFFIITFFYYFILDLNYKVYGDNLDYSYHRLTHKVLNKLISIDEYFTRKISRGRLMNSINTDLIDISSMNDQIGEVLTSFVQIVVVLFIVLFYQPVVFLVFLLFTFLYIYVRNNTDVMVHHYYKKSLMEDDKYSNLLRQIMDGLQEIKAFHMLPKFHSKLSTIQNKFTNLYYKRRNYYTMHCVDVKILTYFFRFVLYLLMIYFIMMEKSDVSVLILIVTYHDNLVTYIDNFINGASKIREVSVSVERVNDILTFKTHPISFGDSNLQEVSGVIQFHNVSLRLYNEYILRNINFTVHPNEVLAIVGDANSGKTMLLNLLLRLYVPSKGKITLDDVDIYEFNRKVYASNVSVVRQMPFIFNFSIRKNLDMVDKNIKHQIEACKKAGVHKTIENLPNGYHTILRANGSNISEGEKQLISIARGILTNAFVLLFDDITTSLDPSTVKVVPKLLQNLKKNHTIILVTKKSSLMEIADRIVVMDHGKIDSVGTHKELMKKSEIYQMLYSRKSPSEEVKKS